jgi:peroxidase
VPHLVAIFAAKGFTLQELVALCSAHMLGSRHCAVFADRIFRRDTNGGGVVRPNHMNPAYAKGLHCCRMCA